ncbi:protein artemis-like isoform X3 [Prorops nasuta]|uniref:protein artemis-like isoform X3 n=1 Tax=Prorops nasuta TaxID=863751 RepID=UPI0034CFA06A
MSTFLGFIEEIPGISVDQFERENKMSSAFFLSHCHADHMKGLSYDFFENLERTERYLYCSPISKAILQHKFYINNLKSGHCPGSVMFLFERNNMSILYTGDFRINSSDFPKLKNLHFNDGNKRIIKKINKIYLDTTFLQPEFEYLPSRQESVAHISKIAKEWVERNSNNIVVLECSANYGSEFLFMELGKSLNIKIHVKDAVYQSYCHIKEMEQYITNNPQSTSIHACTYKFQRLLCMDGVDQNSILTIVPSVLRWHGKNIKIIGEQSEDDERTYYVCYSTHASFRELKEFVKYFNPDSIHPCVIPMEKYISKNAFNNLLEELHKMPEMKLKEDPEKLFLNLSNCNKSKMTDYSIFSGDEDD